MTFSIKKKIVVVGGGFAGINFISELDNNENFEIILVDSNNYNHFTPLLYQVATAFIEASNICYPFRKLFQNKPRRRFHLGSLERINYQNNTIKTKTETIEYDFLVLAVGTETNYFGNQNIKQLSMPMKTVDDALNLRNHLLLSFEKASQTDDFAEKIKYLNIVIAGGGPSGVEVAGMLAEMRHYLAKKDYPEFTNLRTKVFLVDMSPVLLSPMSKKAQQEALEVLTNLGVAIKLNTAVKDYSNGQVILSDGETIPTNTLIWTSGVIGREIIGLPENAIGRGRRILVNQFNQVNDIQNIFAIGDIATMETTKYPQGHPMMAQPALQQGDLLGENIIKLVHNKPMKPFEYNDKGSMATIGRNLAVVDLPNYHFSGIFAWFVWMFVHLVSLIGFKNKAVVFLNWVYNYIRFDREGRLIIRPFKKKSFTTFTSDEV